MSTLYKLMSYIVPELFFMYVFSVTATQYCCNSKVNPASNKNTHVRYHYPLCHTILLAKVVIYTH